MAAESAFLVGAGAIIGIIIVVGTFLFNRRATRQNIAGAQYNNENYYSEPRRSESNNRRCSLCCKSSGQIKMLMCGHGIHEDCLYQVIIKSQMARHSRFSNLKCLVSGCPEKFPEQFLTDCVNSRCWCKESCDSTLVKLPCCKFAIHKLCLEADCLLQDTLKNGPEDKYKCFYCKRTIPFDEVKKLHK